LKPMTTAGDGIDFVPVQLTSRSICIAACVYGSEFSPLLATFLESWSNFNHDVYIAYDKIPAVLIAALSAAYPRTHFVEFKAVTAKKKAIKISQKMIFWEGLSRSIKATNTDYDFVIFADIDTIAVRDPSPICSADIVITKRSQDSNILLNSGVVSVSRAALDSGFIEAWAERNKHILTSPQELADAISPVLPFGGADQKALIDLLGINAESEGGTWNNLQVEMKPCAEFNACENKVDFNILRILHLKASVQSYLLRRQPFIGPRTPKDTALSVTTAIQMLRSATERIRPSRDLSRHLTFRTPVGARADCTVPVWVLVWALLKVRLRTRGSAIKSLVGRYK